MQQNGQVGLYDILVDPPMRRQGCGERVVRALLGWGCQRQAHSAYLQVMHNNPPALRLYARVGFREAYTCLLYTSPDPRDRTRYRMPSSA